jgi:hypothetical protein
MTARLANPTSPAAAAALGRAARAARAAERRAQYVALRADGATMAAAEEKIGVRHKTALAWERERAECAGLPREPTPAQCRREDYAELRAEGRSVAEAADRLRVARRTAERYEAARRGLAGASR